MIFNKIEGFHGEYRWMSNFYSAQLCWKEIYWPSVEYAYVASKTLNPNITEILGFRHPGQVKRYGSKLEIREDFDDIKLSIMLELQLLKYLHNPELHAKLVATGDALIEETNTWNDTFWGVCEGVGKNAMGIILMRVRNIPHSELKYNVS